MTEWDGRPQNPERDSDGHVWRIFGEVDVYRWVAKNQLYEDRRGRWAAPADLLADGDIYLGRIAPPDEIERLRAERDALKAECYAVGENYEIAKRGQLSAEAERDAAERHADALLRDCAEAEAQAVANGRREGIEAAVKVCDERMHAYRTGAPTDETMAAIEEVADLLAAIRALLEASHD